MGDDTNFSIGKYQLTSDQFLQLITKFPYLETITKDTKINGPFDGKINSTGQKSNILPNGGILA